MKNASKHADALKTRFRKLAKDVKDEPRQPMDPLRALLVGILSFDVADEDVADALRKLDAEFVDLNELRVATELEVHDLLGVKFPRVEEKATLIRQTLGYIFERESVLSFERMKSMKKGEVRAQLRTLPDLPPFVEAFVMMYGYDSPAFPVDHATLQWLKDEGLVEPQTSAEEAQKFVESNLKGDDLHLFFRALREELNFGEARPRTRKK